MRFKRDGWEGWGVGGSVGTQISVNADHCCEKCGYGEDITKLGSF